MKWLTASNGILLSILGLFLSLAALASSEGKKKPTLADAQLQMGFYDLLSQQKEIYDARITATQGGVISTITSPNDNRFIFKGKFTEQTTQNSQLSFSYSPAQLTTSRLRTDRQRSPPRSASSSHPTPFLRSVPLRVSFVRSLE